MLPQPDNIMQILAVCINSVLIKSSPEEASWSSYRLYSSMWKISRDDSWWSSLFCSILMSQQLYILLENCYFLFFNTTSHEVSISMTHGTLTKSWFSPSVKSSFYSSTVAKTPQRIRTTGEIRHKVFSNGKVLPWVEEKESWLRTHQSLHEIKEVVYCNLINIFKLRPHNETLKTKVSSPENMTVSIENPDLEEVKEFFYLGHNIKLWKDRQTSNITRRICLTGMAFRKLGSAIRLFL